MPCFDMHDHYNLDVSQDNVLELRGYCPSFIIDYLHAAWVEPVPTLK